MDATLRTLAERIAAAEQERKGLAAALRVWGAGRGLMVPVKEQAADSIMVAGVDGGLLKKSFHGFDLLLVRAAGVCFSYKNGKVQKVDYLPSRRPVVEPEMSEETQETDLLLWSALRRLRAEVQVALHVLEHAKPEVLLLHGPVVPHYADKPAKTSPLYEQYTVVRDLYRRLYEAAGETVVAGVIEDARGTAFCDHLRSLPDLPEAHRKRLEHSKDSTLLYHLLAPGERTCAVPYTQAPEAHPVLRDFPGAAIWTFFLKSAAYDRPIRVDILGQDVEWLAQLLLGISGKHPGYGMPAPLIEADQVAKIPEEEMDAVAAQLFRLARLRPEAALLRREQRPF